MASLLAVSLVATLMAATLSRSAVELRAAQRYAENAQAFQLAEGAVDEAIVQLLANPGLLPTSPDSPVALTLRTPAVGQTYQATVRTLLSGRTQIDGSGHSTLQGSGVQRAVRVVVNTPQTAIPWALFGEDGVSLGIASNVTGDLRTNSTAPGAVSLGILARLQGNAMVGVGGNPNSVLDLSQWGAVVTGTKTAAPEALTLPPIQLPSGSPCAGGGPLVVGLSQTAVIDLSDPSLCYTSIHIGVAGSLRVIGSGQLVLSDMSLDVASKITFEGQAVLVTKGSVSGVAGQMQLASPDASLKLYATDRLQLGVAAQAGAPTSAKNFQVYYEGTDPVDLGIAGQFRGGIYAPNATIRTQIAGSVNGALVGKRLTMGIASQVTYEDALDVTVPGTGVSRDIESWTDN